MTDPSPDPQRKQSYLLNAALVVTSGFIWCGVWLANMYLMSGTKFAPGIDLVFLPAGFRLLIVIVFGVWGALGIFLTDPLMYMIEFGRTGIHDMLINALISGFAPYFTVKAFSRMVGIEGSLIQLRPIHLPLLALAVSVVTPLLFNLHFLLTGRTPPAAFLPNFTAMAMGDFLGCLIVSVLARLGLAAGRAVFPPAR